MVSVISNNILEAPSMVSVGAETPTYRGSWITVLDTKVDGQLALALAQATGTPPVPSYGAAYQFDSPGGGPTSANASALALDFSVNNRDAANFPEVWKIDVTWRPPRPGAQEQPDQVGTPPLDRAPEVWIEYQSGTRAITEGEWRGVDPLLSPFADIKTADGFVAMRNAVGEPLDPDLQTETEPIIVVARNVATDLAALQLNGIYGNRLNNATWTVRGLAVDKHKAMCTRATTGRAQFENGVKYYRQETRIAIGRREWYYRRPHMGQYYVNTSGVRNAFADDDGINVYDGLLFPDGTRYNGIGEAYELVYRTLPDANFNALSTSLGI